MHFLNNIPHTSEYKNNSAIPSSDYRPVKGEISNDELKSCINKINKRIINIDLNKEKELSEKEIAVLNRTLETDLKSYQLFKDELINSFNNELKNLHAVPDEQKNNNRIEEIKRIFNEIQDPDYYKAPNISNLNYNQLVEEIQNLFLKKLELIKSADEIKIYTDSVTGEIANQKVIEKTKGSKEKNDYCENLSNLFTEALQDQTTNENQLKAVLLVSINHSIPKPPKYNSKFTDNKKITWINNTQVYVKDYINKYIYNRDDKELDEIKKIIDKTKKHLERLITIQDTKNELLNNLHKALDCHFILIKKLENTKEELLKEFHSEKSEDKKNEIENKLKKIDEMLQNRAKIPYIADYMHSEQFRAQASAAEQQIKKKNEEITNFLSSYQDKFSMFFKF